MKRAPLALVLVLVLDSLALGAEPPPPTPPEVYRARREALLAKLAPGETVFLRGAPPVKVEWAMPFRQDSDFYYLTGVTEPGAALLLRGRTETEPARTELYLPARDAQRERWEGTFLHWESPAAKALGFDRVRKLDGDPPNGAKGPEAIRRHVHAMRLVKDEHEIALLRRAMRITGDALVEAMRTAEPGLNERDLAALIEYVFRRGGASGPGFPSIVGSGPNSCVLHYNRNERAMRAGDLVVCDVGAEYGRYTADVTRTFPVSGTFTPEQRKVYEAVLRAQEAGFAAVRPGATIRDVHRAALESLRRDGLADVFFHGTSHWLGLDVHDVGRYDAPLAPGMLLTVEPGAYLADKAIGVRIEDDVLVTEDGCEIMTSWIPRTVTEIEAVMREKGLGNQGARPYRPDATGRRVGAF